MKLTTILMLAFCLHTSAKGVAQQTITFSGKEVSLENVFNAIKKQTSYRFFFNTDAIPRTTKVTIDVKNAPIEQVMHLALKDQPLTFAIKGRTIFIMKKMEEDKSSLNVEMSGDPVTVSGKVTDDKGQALVGANVKVKGSQTGVITDDQGRFILNNVDPNATLEISFVGHETQSLSVKGKTIFTVALGQKIGQLDETVVIAYGTTSRRFTTGNIASIKASDIEKQPVSNPLLALQGNVAGMEINQTTGVPGGGVTVRIRGRNSINSALDPLYIVDGVPYQSQNLPNIGSILQTSGLPGGQSGFNGNPLSYINPSDIESIEVLKDADATAIYGSRAANGAVLITTKKGKSGATRIDANVYYGWGNIARKADLLDRRQYLDMRYEALSNDGVSISNVPSSSYDLNGTWDTTRSSDWQKILIGGTANFLNIQTSISGGTENVQYLISGTYNKQTTVFPGDLYDQKGAIHFNISSNSINKKLKIIFTGNYLVDNNHLMSSDLTSQAMQLAPVAPELYNWDGSYNWQSDASGNPTFYNPLPNYILRTYKNKTNNLVASSVLTYQIMRNLQFISNFGYNNTLTNEIIKEPLTVNPPAYRASSQRRASYSKNSIENWIIEPQLNFTKSVSKFKFEALVGTTIQRRSSDGQIIQAQGFNSDLILDNVKAATSTTFSPPTIIEYKYNALFSRVNLNWDNSYIINLTGRRDGSSRFGPANKFHNFGAIGIGWIFSNQNFFAQKLPFLSFGKIRASYGSTGNDQIGDYRYLDLYIVSNPAILYQGTSGLTVNSLNNPELAWEETKKAEVGLDLGFFNDRVLINASYFLNKSSNQLASYSLPTNVGFTSIASNLDALIQNSGWEITFSSKNIQTGDFKWDLSFNLTLNRNKLIRYGANFIGGDVRKIGKSLNTNFLYKFAGVNETTGIYQFLNSQDSIVSKPVTQVDDIVTANMDPQYYGGILNSFSYKDFQLSILFQFVKQNAQNYNFGALGSLPGFFNGGLGNQPISVLNNRWQKSGDFASVQKYTSTFNFTTFNAVADAQRSDAAYSDASFIRLKNIHLSYSLANTVRNKMKLKSCKLYFQCQNLLTITNYRGADPETKSMDALPPLRIMTIGIQVGL